MLPEKERSELMMEIFDDEKLGQMYTKVVENANKDSLKKGFIKCPSCGEEILMIPTLRVMNEAIEKHVQIHKNKIKKDQALKHQTPIFIRLALMRQVLEQVYKKVNS
jgi:uncharacterized protein with PIN domain